MIRPDLILWVETSTFRTKTAGFGKGGFGWRSLIFTGRRRSGSNSAVVRVIFLWCFTVFTIFLRRPWCKRSLWDVNLSGIVLRIPLAEHVTVLDPRCPLQFLEGRPSRSRRGSFWIVRGLVFRLFLRRRVAALPEEARGSSLLRRFHHLLGRVSTNHQQPRTRNRRAYLGVCVPARRVSSLRHWTHFGQWPLSCHPDGRICLESPRQPQTKEQRYAIALESSQQLRLRRNGDKERNSKRRGSRMFLVLFLSVSVFLFLSRTCVLNKATRGRTVDEMQ